MLDRATLETIFAAMLSFLGSAAPLILALQPERFISVLRIKTDDDPYAFGSGSYGEWQRDRFGSPLFKFRGRDASTAPSPAHAVPPRPYPSVYHRVGNDRLAGAALTDGSLLLRHDERGTTLEGVGTFLGRAAPYTGDGYNVSGGGWGFLVDATDESAPVVLAQTREEASVTPVSNLSLGFGLGYVQKNVSVGGVSVSQAVFAPFGSDPVLLSETTITNKRSSAATLRWTEVWPGTTVSMNEHGKLNYVRTVKHSKDGYRIHATVVPNVTVPAGTKPLPFPANITAGASWFDPEPLPVFFVAIRCEGNFTSRPHTSGATTRASDLFAPPHSAASPRPTSLNGSQVRDFDNSFPARTATAGVYAIERTLVLQPGESAQLRSLFGYEPAGFDAFALKSKYTGERGSLRWTVEQWAAMPQPSLEIGGAQGVWIERELRWHSYMLRAGLTRYERFYNETMLSQAGSYEWDGLHGGEGNARDPLSHVLPFLNNGGDQAAALRSVVQLILKSKRAATNAGKPSEYGGRIPGFIGGNLLLAAVGPATINPSDEEMYLLLTASEYILAQRDTIWLDTKINSPFNWTSSVGDSMWQSFLHTRDSVGVGEHGLLRMQTADHNDGILGQFQLQNASCENHSVATAHGESVMNAGLAAYSLRQYAEALTLAGGATNLQRAEQARAFALSQRVAAAKTWSSCPPGSKAKGWFKRAWLGSDALGWRGQCGGVALAGQPAGGIMWTETQSWNVLGETDAISNRTADVLHSIETLARKPSPIGAINAVPSPMEDKGTSYGGVWSCGNQALTQALGKHGSPSTFDEWRKNLLATHADQYPHVFFGVLTGPDVYNSVLSRTYQGSTRCFYQKPSGLDGHTPGCDELANPVLNSWSHSAPLVGVASLVGAEWQADGMTIVPALPSLSSFNLSTPLFGVARAAGASYSGWWRPEGQQTSATVLVSLRVQLPAADAVACTTARVNGASKDCQQLRNGTNLLLRGSLPMSWSLRLESAGSGR